MFDTLADVYKDSFYRSCYEVQKGFGVGFDVSALNNKQVQTLLNKPWSVDGVNFSQKIWNNKVKLINTLDQEMSKMILTGSSPQQTIQNIRKAMDTSLFNAKRLVLTEQAYFTTIGQKDAFDELDVEEFEVVATLDSRTSEICQSMDGQHFPVKDMQAGVNAPPFHPLCRSTTCPYFDDEFSLEDKRVAKDEETGEWYEIPANMTYPEWKKAFGDTDGDKSDLKEISEASLRTKSGGDYGVNWKIVKSKEYTERFNALSDNEKVNSLAVQRSRNALSNRNGKNTEELYAISLSTGKDVSSITDQHYPFGVKKTEKFISDVERAEKQGEKVLLIHNHPQGFPPSMEDINELLSHTDTVGITVGHNGSLYYYTKPFKTITKFDFTVALKKNKHYNNKNERYIKAMEELAKQFGFEFRIL
jgi:SPP1 gp7 family putative phage head morphogenesis protein